MWSYAFVYFPSHPDDPVRIYESGYRERAAALENQKPLPAVVFSHGCEGFRPTFWEANFPKALAQAGYVVFVPDSFARGPSRTQQCHHIKWDTLSLRHEEVDDAVKRLQVLSWVDTHNLFLAGHSEGGMSTATYEGDAFNAYFISGWTCTTGSRDMRLNSIHAPANRPVLAVIGDKDEYYPLTGGRVHCGNRMEGRAHAKSVVMPGYDHGAVPRDPAIGVMLAQFFDQYRVPD